MTGMPPRERAGCFTFIQPSGGYFVWVQLPDNVTASSLLPVAERRGVTFLPGSICAPTASPTEYARSVRLCFAYNTAEHLVMGVKRLTAAVAEVQGLDPTAIPFRHEGLYCCTENLTDQVDISEITQVVTWGGGGRRTGRAHGAGRGGAGRSAGGCSHACVMGAIWAPLPRARRAINQYT
eukprot:CAMPEP_0181257046 /NCGR_PEP_ID=MMETSP1096-20121128/50039_1 /TAXON_ID=156174 ORGANISM="Chrysochromulina ericina, Strain CCMP281" /NCGR_SAMPLE_ID=MMETSP1096 /ASSEMBLY_ACC=CAM_ASM_000453 /LENGTH=179 /DNA_ID=CAMNT_0023355345 /DNA_START=117 /DNA_END=658 /DNA_ORIENTATION=+